VSVRLPRINGEKAYQVGFCDGCEQAKRDLRDETDKAIDRLDAKSPELEAETRAMRTALARLRTLDSNVDTEREPVTRLLANSITATDAQQLHGE
jgi:enoyl-CoA hydratase/carnithine racemase